MMPLQLSRVLLGFSGSGEGLGCVRLDAGMQISMPNLCEVDSKGRRQHASCVEEVFGVLLLVLAYGLLGLCIAVLANV